MEKSNPTGEPLFPFGQCRLAALPVRAEPNHPSEMVTQLLYKENYQLLGCSGDWHRIKCQHDGYEGWLPTSQIWEITANQYHAPILNRQTALLITDKENSMLTYLGTPNYDQQMATSMPPHTILELALQYINTPYLWGGRTPSGIDCSGLVQVVFASLGKKLPRDAYQQAIIGQKIDWQNRKIGDVAFFENDQNRITHVGILSDVDKIVHASAWVRVDLLTEEGIFHNNKKTHSFSHFQRF